MRNIETLIYRYLTAADFFNIYKPTGTEQGGGGQLYIDFLTSRIPVRAWQQFFSGIQGLRQQRLRRGPEWQFPIHSVGAPATQDEQILRIYQRRPASICIPNQNINTRSANRVWAWDSANGFPAPRNPRNRNQLPAGLAVFLVRTFSNEIWAGWLRNRPNSSPAQTNPAARMIGELIDSTHVEGDVGILTFPRGALDLDTSNAAQPFAAIRRTGSPPATPPSSRSRSGTRRQPKRKARRHQQRTEDEIVSSLLSEDIPDTGEQTVVSRQVITRIKQRNQRAVRDLKALYGNRCQISGDRYTFPKRDGVPYTEAHHLIPLGCGGADDPRNIVIVSPLIHRMLHYADVSEIDLSRIVQQRDGSATLPLEINGQEYTITWHAEHANRIRRHAARRRNQQ